MLNWELSPPLGAPVGSGPLTMDLAHEMTYRPLMAHTAAPKAGAYVNMHHVNNLDLKPPGVRDNVANPGFFLTTQHRTELFDPQHTVNPAPIPNWDTQSDMITNPQARRLGAYWWDVTRSQNTWMDGRWEERGQFSVPKVGFTSLKDLRPASVYQFV